MIETEEREVDWYLKGQAAKVKHSQALLRACRVTFLLKMSGGINLGALKLSIVFERTSCIQIVFVWKRGNMPFKPDACFINAIKVNFVEITVGFHLP